MFGLFKKGYTSISPKEAKSVMDSDKSVVLIDVRTPNEFKSARIPNSISVPLNNLIAGIQKVATNKDTTLIIYCQSGARASSACSELTKIGYTNIRNLGGIMSWPYETINGR